MRRYLSAGLGLCLGLSPAWAGDDGAAVPASRPAMAASIYPHLAPEQRAQKARVALDPSVDEKTRFYAVWGLAVGFGIISWLGYVRTGTKLLSANGH